MSIKNKAVLVTGGAGFIGSHLVDRLIDEGAEKVVAVDSFFLGKERNLSDAFERDPGLVMIKQDVTDEKAVEKLLLDHGIDVVYNLAVIPLPASLDQPAWTYSHNNDIALSICELARKDKFKTLIHFSSSEAYGSSISGPMDENHPLNATTPYAASKAAGDLLVLSYCQTFGIDASIIRPFNNYGPRQNENSYAGVIPLTIKHILKGENPVIFGDGKQTRDYLYVTDTAMAATKIYETKSTRHRVLNIASGKEVAIEYLMKLLVEYMDSDLEVLYERDRPADVRRHIANVYLAEDLIGFKQSVMFEDGLKRTVEWYKNNIIM